MQNWRVVGGREEMSKEEAGVRAMTRHPLNLPQSLIDF